MCSPGAASVATQAIGAVTSAVGAGFGAASDKMSLKLDARLSEINSEIEADNARYALEAGQKEEQGYDLKAAQIKSSQRAAMAANNVDLSAGSALAEQVSADYIAATDRKQIRLNAIREAAGYRTQASNYKIDALMKRAAASGISPLLAGVSSLVGSAGKVADSWYTLDKVGALKKPPVTGNPVP